MEDHPLLVFAIERAAPPLRALRDALQAAGYPAGIGVGTVGEATEEQLDSTDWEAAFIRWTEPNPHEVALVERALCEREEEAANAVAQALRLVANYPESAGRLIVADHLRRIQAVYAWQLYDPLLADEDHPAWEALDVALRTLAQQSDGIIYAQAEGFYDADGEMLLLEAGDEIELGNWEEEDEDEEE
ncbi:MAG TPA: hypothetical protein VFB38_05595 [Chthonomonadaceae bacterium]|nr:hypothetical protein [Chthonomonadaceae bacterium]